MNAILAFIPKPVLAGAVILLGLMTAFQTHRIGNLKTENARYETAVEQCAVTNEKNKGAMNTIKLINKQCIDDRKVDETRHANAVAAWNAEKELLQEKADEHAAQIVEVYREPSCEELAKLNISDVCPAFVDGLRRRAESNNRVQD